MQAPAPPFHDIERLDAAVRHSGVGLWLNPLPLGELQWNENTKAHFHLPPDARPTIELFFERLHADDRQRVEDAVGKAVAGTAPFDQVYRTVGPDGQQKWIHAVGHVVRGDDGQPRHFDGVTIDITPQVTAQQRVREFADVAPAILWVTEPNGVCSFLSRGWTEFTGQPEVAGLGFGWLEMVHPDDRPQAQAAFQRANARNEAFVLEHRLRRSDGSWRWVLDAGHPRRGDDGTFLGFAGSVTDIDDRRRAEGEVRASSERYSRLLESIDQGFCVVKILLDAQGRPSDYRFIETNQVFERQTGLRQPLGRTARELVPGLEQFWFDTYGDVALKRESRRFIHGSEAMGRWVDVFASPIGEPAELQVAILFQDISGQVQQQRQLAESEERYRGFLANSTEGIWRMEFQPPVDTQLPAAQQVDAILAHGRFAECNQVFARMYGLDSPDQVVGRGLDLMMDPDAPAVRGYLLALIEGGYRAAEVESQEHDSQGRIVWFANNLSGVVKNGLLVRAWGTQRDITDRKRAQQALVEADRRKDEFLATLAHELRNPLAPIRSAAELVRRTGRQAPDMVRHAELIGRQVGHLARMIDDLMDVSRISRGKLELRLAPVVLQDVVPAAVETASQALMAGEHRLRVDLPPEPVRVVGDEVRLVQVVQNLLANAARYSANGRPVEVSLREEGGQAVLRVRDQGVGIAAEQLDRVFDMFYQGGTESERAGSGGLGIGLSLVQRLAELHGGSAQACSEGLGKGSEFTVRLPLPEAPVQSVQPAPEAASQLRRRKVLVVDDNRDAADTMAEILRVMGYEAFTAYDGVEGVAQAEALRPEVVVLDLGMPRLDGYGACRALRASSWGRGATVVALSGWGQAADVQRGEAAGFDGHLVKPVSPDTLAGTIETLVARRRQQQA